MRKKIKMFTSELQDVFFFGKPFKIQNPISGAIECCIDLSKCILCGNCMYYCPKQAIALSKEYELATDNKFLLKIMNNSKTEGV